MAAKNVSGIITIGLFWAAVSALLLEAEAVDRALPLAALVDPIRLLLFSLIANSGEVCSL